MGYLGICTFAANSLLLFAVCSGQDSQDVPLIEGVDCSGTGILNLRSERREQRTEAARVGKRLQRACNNTRVHLFPAGEEIYQKAGGDRKRELSRQAWGFCCSPVTNSAERTWTTYARRHLVVFCLFFQAACQKQAFSQKSKRC